MADKDVNDTTEVDDVDTEDTTDEENDTEDEYTPPTKDEWTRTQTALKKANDEAKKWRLKVRELEKAKEGETEGAATEASKQVADRYRPAVVRQAAKAALLEAGLADPTPDRVKKVLRLIDTEGVDIDDDGEVAGLDEQIEELKADYPEFFEERRPRVTRVNGADRKASGSKAKTSADLLAAQLFGGK